MTKEIKSPLTDKQIQQMRECLNDISSPVIKFIRRDIGRRPDDSNADAWHLFLCKYLDNRATHPNGLTFVAIQIAEAIDAAFDKGKNEGKT